MTRLVLLFVLIASPAFGQNPVDLVAQALAKFPADAQRIDMLIEATRHLNAAGVTADNGERFGLLRKMAGHNVCREGQCFSVDVVCAGNGAPQEQYDVIRDGPIAMWGKVREPLRRDVCEVFDSGPGRGPGPEPGPTPDPDLDAIREHLSRVDDYLQRLDVWAQGLIADMGRVQQMNAEQQLVIANQAERLQATEAALARLGCRVFLFGCSITGK